MPIKPLFYFFSPCIIFLLFLRSYIFENERSAEAFSTWKVENTAMFYNSEGLHIVGIVRNTDYGDRLAGFRMVLITNATKTKMCDNANI
jgi:hypothetical protein